MDQVAKLDIAEVVATLPSPAQTSFAAYCAEVCLVALGHVEGFDDQRSVINRAVSDVWDRSEEHSSELADSIVSFLPDDDEPGWDVRRPFLQNTAAAALYALQAVRFPAPEVCVHAARQVEEMVDCAWQLTAGGSGYCEVSSGLAGSFSEVVLGRGLALLAQSCAAGARGEARAVGHYVGAMFSTGLILSQRQ